MYISIKQKRRSAQCERDVARSSGRIGKREGARLYCVQRDSRANEIRFPRRGPPSESIPPFTHLMTPPANRPFGQLPHYSLPQNEGILLPFNVHPSISFLFNIPFLLYLVSFLPLSPVSYSRDILPSISIFYIYSKLHFPINFRV